MRLVRATTIITAIFLLQISSLCARAEEPGFVRHFTADHKQLFALNDPLPHVQRLLNSPSLRKVLLEGKIAQLIAVHEPGLRLDPMIAVNFLAQNDRWIPKEVAFGMDDHSLEFMDSVVRLIVLGSVGRGATTLDEPAKTNELKSIEKQFLDQVKKMQMPGLRITARMRQPEDAAALVGMAGLGLRDLNLPMEFQLKTTETSVSLTAKLGDFVQDEVVRQFFLSIGAVTAANSPAAIEMAKLIRAWSVSATLESVGDTMVFTLGPAPKGAPLKVADLGPVFRWDSADILWGRWDATKIKAMGQEWNKLWEGLQETAAGRRAVELDEANLLGRLGAFADQMAASGATGQSRMWIDAADSSLRVEVREQGFTQAPALAQSPILKAIPADAEAFTVTSEGSLAGLVAGSLIQLESQFEGRLDPSQPGAAEISKVFEAYKENFRDFHSILVGKSLDLFDPGAAWLIGTKGTVTKFELNIQAKQEKHSFKGKDLPMMEFALVGRAKDEKKVDALMTDLYSALVKGIRTSAGIEQKEGAPAPAALKQVDLGLGCPTWAFDGSFIDDLAKAGGAKVDLTLEGDLRPHYFQSNGLFVFSTSAHLSKQIIESITAKKPSITLPNTEGRLISFGLFPGQTLAGYLHHAAAWTTAFTKTDPVGAEIAQGLDGAGEFLELINESTWRTVQKGDDEISQSVTTFK